MLVALSAEGVEYLLVGAYAMAAHGVPRATGDIDIWVRPSPGNAERVLRALRHFGAPLLDLKASDLSRDGTVFQLGVPPRRIDLLTSIDGVAFDEAWPERITGRFGELEVTVIGRDPLIRNERAAARLKDTVDVRLLEHGSASRRSTRPKRPSRRDRPRRR